MLDLNYKPQVVVDTDGMENDEWLKYRTTGIGGSDVSAIYGVSPWTTKRALYFAKKGLSKDDSNPFTLSFGHAVEPFVAAWFQEGFNEHYKDYIELRLGVKIDRILITKDTNMYRHPLYPFMQANLDYRIRVFTKDGKTMDGIFECKTTSHFIGADKWNDNKVPYEYELQCRHYMSVMNLGFTIIAVAWGNNIEDYRARVVLRNLDEEEEMINMEQDFWMNNVLKGVAPPLSKEHAEEELKAFTSYKISDRIKDGSLLEIDTSEQKLKKAIESYASTKEKIDALSSQIKELEKSLTLSRVEALECLADTDEPEKDRILKISENTSYIIKNKTSKSRRIDSAKLKNELPDIFEKYSKESESTRFTVTKI